MLANISVDADDHKTGIVLICGRKLVLASYCALLSGHEGAFSVWPFCSAEAFLQEAPEKFRDCDLILYDAGQGCGDDPSEAMKCDLDTMRTQIPGAAITILGDCEDWDSALQAFALPGVRGYIPTTLEPQVAVRALHLISAGGSFIPADCLTPEARVCHPAPPHSYPEPLTLSQPRAERVLACLTKRELEVLEKLRDGKSNKMIAYELKVGQATVKVHVRSILKKLGATNRTQAAMAANRLLMP